MSDLGGSVNGLREFKHKKNLSKVVIMFLQIRCVPTSKFQSYSLLLVAIITGIQISETYKQPLIEKLETRNKSKGRQNPGNYSRTLGGNVNCLQG